MVGIGKAYFYITFSMVLGRSKRGGWSKGGCRGGVIARNEAIFTQVDKRETYIERLLRRASSQ